MQATILQSRFKHALIQHFRKTKVLNGAYVYFMPVPPNEFLLKLYFEILNQNERVRAKSFYFKEDRDAYITAHALLRIALSQHFSISPQEWNFRENLLGKPEQINLPANIYFNISHTRGFVCCALSHTPFIGIDVENIASIKKVQKMNLIFSDHEIQDIKIAPKKHRLARIAMYWTLRESFLKGTGEGINGLSRNFSFLINHVCQTIYFTHQSNSEKYSRKWKFATFLINGLYVVSVAINNSICHTANIRIYFNEADVQLVGVSPCLRIILS